MGHTVEIHFIRNFLCRKLSVHQQVPDFHDRELLNPVAGRASAHLSGYLVQMLGGDAQLLGIVGNRPVLAIAPPLQHLDETRHDDGCPLRGFFALKERGMDIHHIQIEHPHTLQNGSLPVWLWSALHAEGHVPEIMLQDDSPLPIHLEDRVHEQMQPSAYPIAGVGHTACLLVGRQQESEELAILRGLDMPHVTGHSYHATTRRERMLMPGEMKLAGSSRTQEVQNLLLHRLWRLIVSEGKSTKKSEDFLILYA